MSDSIDNGTLVHRIAAGQRSALGRLYDRFAESMMGIGMRRLKDRQEVEDVLHDVFMEVWRNAHAYDEDRGSVRTWLFLLMRSRTLDAARKVRRTRTDSLGEANLDGADLLADDDPSATADQTRVRQTIASLPDRLSEVLLLTYFTGMTGPEVADRVDIPLGTVKSRLRAARQALRDQLVDDPGGAA